jgi:cell division protein FtsB
LPVNNRTAKQAEAVRKKKRTLFVAAGALFIFYLMASFFLGERGLFRYMKMRQEKAALTADIASLKSSNAELQKKVESLKTDPEYIESLAREQGLVKDGETVYQYEDEK